MCKAPLRFLSFGLVFAFLFSFDLRAETGYEAWLRYARLDDAVVQRYRAVIPAVVAVVGNQLPVQSAQQELIRGLRGILGRNPRMASGLPRESAIVVGKLDDLRQLGLSMNPVEDAYWLKTLQVNGAVYTVVTAQNDRGVVYGAFALLRKIALGEPVANLDETQSPYSRIRWVNEWDNLDGSIERGYGGRSIFWESGGVRQDLQRVNDYARMLASIGVNGCSINNVNANPLFLSSALIPQVARVAEVFRRWGIRVALAIDFGSPMTVGGLATYDPLDPAVIGWWKSKTDEIYRAIPDFAGFVLKADSEGRVGPSTYGRTHADAANVVARALKPHGGIMFYRGFVYDHHMDWQNLKNDRARAAYDNFHDLDGKFDDNVIIQIKNGPIDFQVREPASPLFGALEKTNRAIELQITQEYMGQARHLVFLPPMWKATLDFDMRAGDRETPVKALVSGGFVGVSNVGLDQNWFGNHMSQANLYGFGRLAWDPNLTAGRIVDEWTGLTFGNDPKVLETIAGIQLSSWQTYEKYTGPLGLQTLTDIVGNHYGVAVEASERNGWGQWHRADENGVGMDRSQATGTGFVGQYSAGVRAIYESTDNTPDDLLLFMHHVPYTHVLHSGKTVIQYLYDSHFEGAETVAKYVRDWRSLREHIDDQRYRDVMQQLEYQAGHAVVWRDAVTTWFYGTSGIPDSRGRVGHYPGRMEAESAALDGYVVKSVTPWETASGGKAIECAAARCSATFRYDGDSGRRDLIVQYFDTDNGIARFEVRVGRQLVAEWSASARLATSKPDGSSSTRRMIRGVALRRGDEIRIQGMPDAGDAAALDYLEILPAEN
jgi:alpha-glucuronidase